ncbi:hypothetical protein [Flavobacterium johnsoniae]|uniref:Uncharacterized protein n=2 Tax=Flavobacterium johnsoniae TaxID=986 RepID=A5FDM4_FLAJ1|nr:hypothetical protein [Flavobacterium johnsoniae]ABQ06702.1 hypothetical protein Fjoh_3688 [Flavobacterium johnsoniae UW101]WQG82459.1 hypothetical protein SR927_04930 [Flavobacterium johnsoniae UW101]SHM01915.1 hypothetical protein SAMN05444146_5197 [Flavobacterium johnsoniae]
MDGGYYAIKGFEFQIDKTILEILNTNNENKKISIEQIQDINSSDYVMQIKYKETQDYTPNKIREPIVQLIDEFKKNDQINYNLFCFFKDKSEQKKKITLVELEEILQVTLKSNSSKKLKALKLKIDSYNLADKKNFIKKFNLIFAPNFQIQFEEVISKIRNLGFCKSDDEAIFYYSSITDYFRKLVVNKTDPTNRSCTQKDIINYIKDGRNLVFTSSFIDYKGEVEYLKFLKTNFIKPVKNQENFIFIGNVVQSSELTIGQLIVNLIDKYYDKATYDIKPLTFIVNDKEIFEVKKEMSRSNLFFNDGYESILFNSELFFQKPIINRKTSGGKATESLAKSSFKLRIISKNTFDKNYNNEINPRRVYYFMEDLNNKLEEKSFIKIDQIDTKQVQKLFNT